MAYHFRSRILFPKFLSDILLPSPFPPYPPFPVQIRHLSGSQSPVYFQPRPISSYRRRLQRSRERALVPENDTGEVETEPEPEPEPEPLKKLSPQELEFVKDNYHVADWVKDEWFNEAINNRSIEEMLSMRYLIPGTSMIEVPGPKGKKRKVNEVRAIFEALNSWDWDDEEGENVWKVKGKKKKKEKKKNQDQDQE